MKAVGTSILILEVVKRRSRFARLSPNYLYMGPSVGGIALTNTTRDFNKHAGISTKSIL